MDCYCDDVDGPSVSDEKTVRARKHHKCSGCGGAIVAGETYRHLWGVWDGKASTFKWCTDCLELEAWAEAHVPCICWDDVGRIHDTILDAMSEYDAECPGLYDEAKAKIAEVRDRRRLVASLIVTETSK